MKVVLSTPPVSHGHGTSRRAKHDHQLFKGISDVHVWAHHRFNVVSVYSRIRMDDQTECLRVSARPVSCTRVYVGLVIEPYEPMSLAKVVEHYTADKLITDPGHLAILFSRMDQDQNYLEHKMANLFFWRVRDEVRLVVLGRCGEKRDQWMLRTYPLDQAPDYLAGCRIFIPA